LVQFAIGDAHAPDEVGDICDLFLVRFGGKDDGGSPGPFAWVDPTIIEENIDLIHDDFTFMRSVVRFSAADWGGTTGVDGEVKV
jgi:hypothetical protein